MSQFVIHPISFSSIEIIWRSQLWPDRKSAIESVSWVNSEGSIDMNLKIGSPYFFGVYVQHNISQLVGVCSGFRTAPEKFRTRGLFVSPEYRKMGIGEMLVNKLIEVAKVDRCEIVWTMPRLSAWGFYKSLGFIETQQTSDFEYGPHILAEKTII